MPWQAAAQPRVSLALAPTRSDCEEGQLSASVGDSDPQRSSLVTSHLHGNKGFCSKILCALHSLGMLPEK